MRSASRASNSQQKTINNIVKYEQNCSVSFTGKERDRETGFSYFGALYYDSYLSGLFLSVNPMNDKYQSISLYGYFSGKTPACLEQIKLKYLVACKFT